jgi:autotransporter-associated beta strand protein
MRIIAPASGRRRIPAAGLVVAIFVAWTTSESQAATITFTIKSSQSTLNAAMTFGSVAATAQTPGSLSDTYSGSITGNLAGNTLTFSGGSSIVALAATASYVPPLGGSNTEGSPQNYGAYFQNISIPFYTFNSDADLRSLDLDITSGSVAVGSAGSGLTFTAESGAANYSVPALPLYGVTAGYYSKNFSGTTANNASSSLVTLAVAGSTETLTIPVNATINFTEEGEAASVNLTGNLVATAVAPSSGTWTAAGNGSWATAGNWSSNPALPASSGTATFAGASAPVTVTLDGNQAVGALLFNPSGAGGYTLSRGTGGALTLGTSTAGASIAVLSGAQTISAPVVLAGSLTVSTTGGGSLNLSGSVSQATPGSALTLDGSGEVVLGGAGSFSGGTTVNGGTLQLGNVNALGSGGLTVNGGAVDLAGSSPTVSGLSGPAGLITDSGGNASTLTVDQTSTTTFGGSLRDGPAAQIGLALTGSGTLVLSGTSSYSGGTSVEAGTLVLTDPGALAGGSSLTVGASAAQYFDLSLGAVASPADSAAAAAAVPEPGTLALLAAGLWSAAIYRRFRPRSQTALSLARL